MAFRPRNFAYAGAIALSLALPSVAQASSYVLSTTGSVTSGVDNRGLFGTAGASLAGDKFALSILFDSSLAYTDNVHASDLSGAAAVVSLTVGSKTVVEIITSGWAQLDVQDSTWGSDLYGLATGTATDGTWLRAEEEVGSSNAFVGNDSPTQTIGYSTQAGDIAYANFDLTESGIATDFSASASSVSLQTVPEPAAMGLFGIGLAALGVIRRRKA
jgi:hypothetical protein